jgi:hypothetical protein
MNIMGDEDGPINEIRKGTADVQDPLSRPSSQRA